MADWRQIRARIRRAKSGPDPATRLEQLFDKTRDGMVAFELAQLEEESGRIERAADWYKRAWQRFRRSEWKQKAEEALVRHGIPIPPEESPRQAEVDQPASAPDEISSEMNETMEFEPQSTPEQVPALEQVPDLPPAVAVSQESPEAPEVAEETATPPEREGEAESEGERQPEVVLADESQPSVTTEAPARPRRRRHRGGRGRGRGKRSAESPDQTPPESDNNGSAPAAPRETDESEQPKPADRADHRRAGRRTERRPGRASTRSYVPQVQIYRRGEPALASKIKALEAKLRQLLASTPHTLGEAGELPANPGVFLLSDLDLTTMYYLEACGNMRSAIDQLVSGRRGRQGSVRSRLAKYLGITDSQAGRYLKEHCAARWIDLDESDSNALGHFARAVLRPELMEESD